jgi:hypothetical protein
VSCLRSNAIHAYILYRCDVEHPQRRGDMRHVHVVHFVRRTESAIQLPNPECTAPPDYIVQCHWYKVMNAWLSSCESVSCLWHMRGHVQKRPRPGYRCAPRVPLDGDQDIKLSTAQHQVHCRTVRYRAAAAYTDGCRSDCSPATDFSVVCQPASCTQHSMP